MLGLKNNKIIHFFFLNGIFLDETIQCSVSGFHLVEGMNTWTSMKMKPSDKHFPYMETKKVSFWFDFILLYYSL